MILSEEEEECPVIPRSNTYIIDKNVDNHWRNEYVRGYHKIISQCFSIDFDSSVYYDNKLVSYTSTSLSNTYFLNCNDENLLIMTIGDYLKIENTEIILGYLFRDRNDIIIGYSSAKYELSDVIMIKDFNGDQVATLKKSKLGIGWMWNITIVNQDHVLSDPSILLALVGKMEFGESEIDGCNFASFIILAFFFGCCISILILIVIVGMLILYSHHT